MELWTIANKAVLLLFVTSMTFAAAYGSMPHSLLAILIYLCLNMAIAIMKKQQIRITLALLSAALSASCSIWLNPLFMLLLVPNLFEIIRGMGGNGWQALIGMVLPLFFLPDEKTRLLYGLVALLCLLFYVHGTILLSKLRMREEEGERMREDIVKLTRELSKNLEYIRQSEYTSKLEERNRLSQQIHDEVGHSMAGALIQMEASRRLLDRDRPKADELLGNAISISKEGLERIRLTLKNAKPPAEQMGIGRLQLFLDELGAKHSMSAMLHYAGDLDAVTPIQWRIIQSNTTEAVTNTLKYAGASSIHVEIHVLNTVIKAVVADDGTGAIKVVKGLGIVGMEERTAAAGGTVIVDGAKGFRVTTLLPRRPI